MSFRVGASGWCAALGGNHSHGKDAIMIIVTALEELPQEEAEFDEFAANNPCNSMSWLGNANEVLIDGE